MQLVAQPDIAAVDRIKSVAIARIDSSELLPVLTCCLT